jgi:hypothetical protein
LVSASPSQSFLCKLLAQSGGAAESRGLKEEQNRSSESGCYGRRHSTIALELGVPISSSHKRRRR